MDVTVTTLLYNVHVATQWNVVSMFTYVVVYKLTIFPLRGGSLLVTLNNTMLFIERKYEEVNRKWCTPLVKGVKK